MERVFHVQLLKTPNLMKTCKSIHFAVPVPNGGGRSEKSQAAATGLHSKSMGAADTNVKTTKNTAVYLNDQCFVSG